MIYTTVNETVSTKTIKNIRTIANYENGKVCIGVKCLKKTPTIEKIIEIIQDNKSLYESNPVSEICIKITNQQ